MRFLWLIAVSFGALAQPGAPIFTHSGPLACGMRLYSPGHVQHWCFDYTDTMQPKIICNAINTISPLTPGDTPMVATSNSCFGTILSQIVTGIDGSLITPCAVYEVTWLVWQPIVAIPPGTTGTIKYQIASYQQSGTVHPNGACVADPAITSAPAVLQEGSFSNGILAAGLQIWHIEGQPVQYVDTEPNVHWTSGYGSGISILNNETMAQASWQGGFCQVTSTNPGIVQFVYAADSSVKVGWIPDSWCTDNADFPVNGIVLTGQCSPLTLIGQFTSPHQCAAAPNEPVRQAVIADLAKWDQVPVVQGK